MASKSTADADVAASSNVLPTSIIAQAEAAIAANADDGPPALYRSPHGNIRSRSSRVPSGPLDSQQKSSDISSGAASSISHPVESPPPYGDHLDRLQISQDGFDTQVKLTDDGRVDININQKTARLSDLLVPALRNQLSLASEEAKHPLPPGYIPPALGGRPGQQPPPPMNVVIHVVGSRGDVQPFVALGKILISTYGHRVRLATHPTFKSFVEENGLEFFSIGGDPAELMAFMVKNPGLMPGMDSLKSGDVGKRRKGMEEIVQGCWRSCIESGDGLGAPTPTSKEDAHPSFATGINMETSPTECPFIADAIIANPPSFAHVHIAEKLGIPLHLMFTMPWSPTQSFPHPLANIQSSNADANMTNYLSYTLVEMMTWQGLGDIINRFRERTLGLESISMIWAPAVLTRLKIPYTYCWSPALIPKPKDWGQHISISGFYFLSLASSYNPELDLATFLANGPPPVYIGFGSIVVDDPDSMTKLIFDAVKRTGVRALVSKGWGGLGAEALGVPEGVFMLGNVPHDWLFKHVSCVVHHGGAGTTAAGISLGRPTVIVPFFGDQPFWGNMTFRAGAGPAPIPYKQLTAEKLAAAIEEALKPTTLERAKELGGRIQQEKGTDIGGKSFHDHLNVNSLRCSLAPSRVAVWQVKRTEIRLSALAATVLANEGLLNFADLKLYRAREYDTESGPWDPISGGASALLGTIASLSMGVADFPMDIFKAFKGKSSSKLPPGSSDARDVVAGSAISSSTSLSRDEASSGDDRQVSGDDNADSSVPTTLKGSSPGGGKSPDGLHSAGGLPEDSLSTHAHESDPGTVSLESAIGAGKGVSRIVGAGLKSPMDFTLGLARGFHNAPKLYGDDTVRPQEKVTDFQSGLKAAGKGFGFGVYDGISGLVTQPMRGAEKEGAAGLIKGIGKGLAGAFLKPGAAIWGLPGYTFMGIHKEIRKLFGSSVANYIISARTAQGYEHWKLSTPGERNDIVIRWHEAKPKLQTETRNFHQDGSEGQGSNSLPPRGFLQTRHLSFDERKRLHEERTGKNKDGINKQHPREGERGSRPSRPEASPPVALGTQEDLEQAIRTSVASTSRGNAEEDLLIERAIRASVRELQSVGVSSTLTEQQALDRAVEASVLEASRYQASNPNQLRSSQDAQHDTTLKEALQKSLYDDKEADHGTANVDTDDDSEFKSAIAASKAHAEGVTATNAEEEIVLEYIKKQSLAEAEHKKSVQGKQDSSVNTADEDMDLRRAIEESVKSSRV